jgi:hypothetical protein
MSMDAARCDASTARVAVIDEGVVQREAGLCGERVMGRLWASLTPAALSQRCNNSIHRTREATLERRLMTGTLFTKRPRERREWH